MWSSTTATATRNINCGLPPEFYFVAPASSFQHHHQETGAAGGTTINFDPHSLGVIPLLTATPCLGGGGGGGSAAADDHDALNNNARNRGGGGGGMQLWQHQLGQQNSPAYFKKPTINIDHSSLLHHGVGGGVNIGGSSSSSMGGGGGTTTSCHDCGNQAKKDCPHRRCRTCCKSRGYDCTTHLKSTWVPAARRRERQVIGGANTATAGSSQSTSSAKKPRLGGASQTTSHTSNSNNTPPRSFDTTSSHHQDASFKESLPGQVHAPAVFKCVRVTAVDDGEDEYAYQAVVRIGGHVFKGFLYDQGSTSNSEGRSEGGFPNMSELHLGGGGRNAGTSSSQHTFLDAATTDMFAASGGALLGGGSSYGNQIN
ncbi:hypothetical protein ABFS83_04G063900 [Erythranthe nasuta]